MHRFARLPSPLRFAAKRAFWRSRWKLRHCMPSPTPVCVQSFVWRTFPIGLAAWRETSKKETGTAFANRSDW